MRYGLADSAAGRTLKRTFTGSSSPRCYIFAAAVAAMLPPAQAFAQCAPAPAEVAISSGSCTDGAGTTRSGAGAAAVVDVSGTGEYSGASTALSATGSGHGAQASGGGRITLTGAPDSEDTLSHVTTGSDGSHALHAEVGGQINAEYTSIFTEGANAYGLAASGAGSHIGLTGGAVTTLGNRAYGAYATGGGTIALTGSDVIASGVGAYGFYAGPGGSITLTDLNAFISGDNSPAAVAIGAGGSLVLDHAFMNTYGNNSAGLFATEGGIITASNGSQIATGNYHGDMISNSPGIYALGAGSTILFNATSVSATTYGTNSPGALTAGGGRIEFAGYGLFTYEPNSPGAHANGAGSTITLTGAIIRTTAPYSNGLLIDDAGFISVTGAEVTTGYTGGYPTSRGDYTEAEVGLEAHGAEVAGTDSQLLAADNHISTSGAGAIGVWVHQGGSAVVTGGSIKTGGADTAAVGGADGVRATGAGSAITVTGTQIVTTNVNAAGLHATQGGAIDAANVRVSTQGQNAYGTHAQDAGSRIGLTGGAISTTGVAAHGLVASDGGALAANGGAIATSGVGSAAIYITGRAPGAPDAVSVTGGSLSAASEAIILAEGGAGAVSISGAAITPAVVNGRLLLAHAAESASGTPANLTLTIDGVAALTGDVVADPSTLTFNLADSAWTGDLALVGPGSVAAANLTASQWTGNVLADPGNTANVALAQGSRWTGLAQNATNIGVDASSAWNVTGDSSATGTLTNAGLVQFLPRGGAYTTLTVGNYTGNGGRVGFNTYLGNDSSPSNLLIVNGGVATGSTSVLVANTGGPGALTTADGIRLVQVVNGGSTTGNAFTLGQRVVAGSYEYQLFRGGSSGADDWFLRSHLTTRPSGGPEPAEEIPLYRPEAALYAPIPAIGRQMGLTTLGTLHERVGEEENLRGLPENRVYANGAWARAFGQRVRNHWNGAVDSRATGDFSGMQAGFDLLRRTTESGHRDHIGVYVAYTDYSSSSMRGFALGRQNMAVGRLTMRGPSVAAYWTHFGPSGWYTDAVFQTGWYDTSAPSNYGAGLSTNATSYTASLETGYPVRFGEGGRWQVEPQAQIIWQGISVDRSWDRYSVLGWNPEDAWTGRIGLRLLYTGQDARGTLWQPYARVNLWHAFSGSDRTTFGAGAPVISNFGNTALEIGGGVTARVNASMSLFGQASYRLSLDDSRSRQSAVQGTVGVRFNW